MAAKKTISKSIRMTEEVFALIERAPGKGFNEKFENIILRANKKEGELEKRLLDLEAQASDKLHQLYKLYDTYDHLASYFRNFELMRNQMDALRSCLESAVESLAQSGAIDNIDD